MLIDIEIPAKFVELCEGWAGNLTCMLRAIESTGRLTLGTIRPYDNDEGRHMTDQEWHRHLYGCLMRDIAHCRRAAERRGHEDATALKAFEEWADNQCDMLTKEYGLE